MNRQREHRSRQFLCHGKRHVPPQGLVRRLPVQRHRVEHRAGDAFLGERVKAFVVPHEGESPTADEIIAFCREQLVVYKVPTQVEFRDSLPKSLIGKVLRRVLMEEERQRAVSL